METVLKFVSSNHNVVFFFNVIMIKHLLPKIFLNFTPNVLRGGKFTNRDKSLRFLTFLIK